MNVSVDKSVSFGVIEVRDYERVAGDHPDVNGGVPLAIGWAFVQKEPVTVERAMNNKLRYQHKQMKTLDAEARKTLLLRGFDVNRKEVEQAEKAAKQARSKRQQTLMKIKMEETGRKSMASLFKSIPKLQLPQRRRSTGTDCAKATPARWSTPFGH